MILLSSSLTSFLQLIGVLVIFVLVLAITYVVTKWIGGMQQTQMSGKVLRVLDSVRIGDNKYVQILKTGEVYLVVAVGKDEVTMLAKLTEDEIGLTEEEIVNAAGTCGAQKSAGTQESFQEALDKWKRRFTKKQD